MEKLVKNLENSAQTLRGQSLPLKKVHYFFFWNAMQRSGQPGGNRALTLDDSMIHLMLSHKCLRSLICDYTQLKLCLSA